MEDNLFKNQNAYSIKNYIITEKCLGKGSSASVYLGFDTKLKINIAVKKFILKENDNEKAIREIEILKNINHQNIIKFYDYYTDIDNGIIYIFLEHCSKKSLKSYLGKGGYLDENNTKKIIYQLISGVKYLFDKGIFHRDIKLDNLLLTDDYNLKLADFGLSTKNKTGIFKRLCGSPLYMAPEILILKKYTTVSDIWSIGIVMFEVLFGHNPNYQIKNIDDLLSFYKKNIIKIPPLKKPDDVFLSSEGIDILTRVLKINYLERINWNDLFNHPWFLNTISNDNFININKNTFDTSNNIDILKYKKNDNEINKYSIGNTLFTQKYNIDAQNELMNTFYDKSNSFTKL